MAKKKKKRINGEPLIADLISDEMVEHHLQGDLTIRDIAKKIGKSVGGVHKILAQKIEEFNKGFRTYALARAEYHALKYLNEVLADTNLDGEKEAGIDRILRAKNKVRADMTIKTLEGLGIFQGETPVKFPDKISFISNVPIPGMPVTGKAGKKK